VPKIQKGMCAHSCSGNRRNGGTVGAEGWAGPNNAAVGSTVETHVIPREVQGRGKGKARWGPGVGRLEGRG